MSANQHSREIHPGNILWAAVSLAAVLGTSLLVCNSYRPTVDVEQRKADVRTEVRKKIGDEESAKLASVAWVKKESGLVRAPVEAVQGMLLKELSGKKASPSAVKIDPMPPAAAGGAPSLPSAPGGAVNIQFPKLGAPAPAAPAPAAPAPAAPAPAAPAPAAPAPAAPAPGN
jgi:hypothetical protein